MADIDVAAIALGSPPTQAPVTAYRPAVTVRNNGIAPVTATGWLSVYDRDTGLLVKTFQVSASNIAPGQTKQASAGEYWTPTEAMIGKHFLWTGNVTCPGDQVPGNNTLAPVDIMVTGGTPPGPQPVEDHAGQHENGGGDELNVDGLPGVLVEAQKPTIHAGDHEVNGTDELDLTGMSGQLATAQVPLAHGSTHEAGGADQITGVVAAPHASSHEPGGADEIEGIGAEPHKATHELEGDDEISVEGLSGLLATEQNPTLHASRHEAGGDDVITGIAPGPHSTTHSLDGTDILHGVLGNQIDAHLGLQGLTPVGAGQTVELISAAIVWPVDISLALVATTVQVYRHPDPFGSSSQIVTIVANGAGALNQLACTQGDIAQEHMTPLTLFALVNIGAADNQWTVSVRCQALDVEVEAVVTGLHVIPVQ